MENRPAGRGESGFGNGQISQRQLTAGHPCPSTRYSRLPRRREFE